MLHVLTNMPTANVSIKYGLKVYLKNLLANLK